MSSVVLGSASFLFARYTSTAEAEGARRMTIDRLDAEIGYRLSYVDAHLGIEAQGPESPYVALSEIAATEAANEQNRLFGEFRSESIRSLMYQLEVLLGNHADAELVLEARRTVSAVIVLVAAIEGVTEGDSAARQVGDFFPKLSPAMQDLWLAVPLYKFDLERWNQPMLNGRAVPLDRLANRESPGAEPAPLVATLPPQLTGITVRTDTVLSSVAPDQTSQPRDSETVVGTVKWFNDSRGFGFLFPDDGGADIFVHHSAIQGEEPKTLAERDRVRFKLVAGAKGPAAESVVLLTDGTGRSGLASER